MELETELFLEADSKLLFESASDFSETADSLLSIVGLLLVDGFVQLGRNKDKSKRIAVFFI